MHHVVLVVDADPDKVASDNTESLSEAAHPGALLSVYCVEWVRAAGACANLDDDRCAMVIGDDVDFSTGDIHIAGDDPEALRLQEMTGQKLTEIARRKPS